MKRPEVGALVTAVRETWTPDRVSRYPELAWQVMFGLCALLDDDEQEPGGSG